jgi:hypothetical protein
VAKTNISSLTASYKAVLELVRYKKPFSDGLLIKKCSVEMAKAFGDTNMAEKFETLSLYHRTVASRVASMSGPLAGKLSDITDKCCSFSLYLDETTDHTYVTQLHFFVQNDFSTQEELLNLHSLKWTVLGIDTYVTVKTAVGKFCDFDKCSCVVMDGSQRMVGHHVRLSGILKKKKKKKRGELSCSSLHY